MNQVRVTSPTSPTSYQINIDLMTYLCGSYQMSFAHLTPHDVRFMFRFAQHDSHHMASISSYVGISVHYIYHMFVSFLTPSEAPRILSSRGVHCWNLSTAQKWQMLWWKHSHAIRKRKLKRSCPSTSKPLSVWCVGPSWTSNTRARIRRPTNLKHEFCGTKQVNLERHLSAFTRYWWTTVFPLSSIHIKTVSQAKSLRSSEPQTYWPSRMSPC